MKYLFSVFLALLFFNCQEDDICLDSPTPRLKIRMVNDSINNAVTMDSLVIYALDNGKQSLINQSLKKDSVYLSLPIENVNYAQFIIGNSVNQSTQQDTLTITYERDLQFVSKACGYNVNYLNASFTITQHFFSQLEVLKNQITHEDSAHITLYY